MKLKTKNIEYNDKLVCKICGKKYSHLGSHIVKAHRITCREYKEEFELPYNEALISQEIYQKKVDAFNERREEYIRNLLESSKKFRFKKKHSQSQNRRISKSERDRFIKRIELVNLSRKPEKCPVCRMVFNNLDSHLFNKHKLLRIKQKIK